MRFHPRVFGVVGLWKDFLTWNGALSFSGDADFTYAPQPVSNGSLGWLVCHAVRGSITPGDNVFFPGLSEFFKCGMVLIREYPILSG